MLLTLKEKPDHISKIIPLNFESHGKNRLFSQKNYLSSRNYCADVGFCFDNTAEELTKTAIFFAQNPETFVQLVFFPTCRFSSKKSFQQLECSFDNTVKKFLPNDRRCFTRCPKMWQNWTFFKKTSHGKRFTGPVECTLNNPAPSFFARRPKLFCSWSDKKCKVMSSFGKCLFAQNAPLETFIELVSKKIFFHRRSSPGPAECKCDRPA